MVVEESDEDKRLITGEVMVNANNEKDDDEYPVGSTVIFGKYALFPLTLQGEDFFFLDKEDVIGVCDYKE